MSLPPPPYPLPPFSLSLISLMVSVDVRHHVCFTPGTVSPGEIKSGELELGCHSWMYCFAAELFLNSCFSETVFVTLFHAAVETVETTLQWPCPQFLNIAVLVVADILFSLYWSKCWDKLFIDVDDAPLSPSLIT